MSIFSNNEQLAQIQTSLINYLRLPFSGDTVPGSIMEAILARAHNGEVLRTYDFVDVISLEKRCGWQVKSTKDTTPVTWKRAKIPNAKKLITASHRSKEALQALGNAIIDFCNEHAFMSFERYNLDEIGFSRLILHDNGDITYYERLLCTREAPKIFNEDDFYWEWSTPKKTKTKEQLPALHGAYKHNHKKWWAWHGLGENQLHFSGEKCWWPSLNPHAQAATFRFPSAEEKVSLAALLDFLSTAK